MRKPEQVIASVMKKLEKHGKGIVLMHDFQQATTKAAPDLLKKLKESGYKVVQVVGKTPTEPRRNPSTSCSRRWAAVSDSPPNVERMIKTIEGNWISPSPEFRPAVQPRGRLFCRILLRPCVMINFDSRVRNRG